jgi:hypothetical protein
MRPALAGFVADRFALTLKESFLTVPIETPFYLDWKFWSVVVSCIAIALSQLPPVYLWFRPKRLYVEVHSRIQITHKVGNPNAGLYVSIGNTGGRELRVRALRLNFSRDNKSLLSLSAQNYFEKPSDQSSVLFVPFSLKPGEHWSHAANFFNPFDRATEKFYRESESVLAADIRKRIQARVVDDKQLVMAEPALVTPFMQLFSKLFIWEPGEYVFELVVEAQPGSASYSKKYRFTLYESDTAELRKYTEDYLSGGGIYYHADRHVGVFVSLSEHVG